MNLFIYTRYRNQTDDYLDGGIFPQTGGQWVYAIPGLNVPFLTNGSLRLSATLPIYRKLNGTQLTTSYKIKAAVSFTIPFKKENASINENIEL
jgi:hypothetical protein